MSGTMTMLDQIWQLLSPHKDFEKVRRKSTSSTSDDKTGRTKKKGKKNEKKPIVEEKKLYLDPELLQHPILKKDVVQVIRKPPFIDEKEWIATHTISLFHNIDLLYDAVSEYCTAESCPLMQGPCQTQYTWVEERGKKLKCTAPQYVDYVMTFCQKCVSNQQLFPTKYAQNFCESFSNDIKKMLRHLFTVISHLYYAHFARLRQMDLHVYLSVVFKHFTYFVREFNLLDRRDTTSLDDLVDAMGLYSSLADVNTSPSDATRSNSQQYLHKSSSLPTNNVNPHQHFSGNALSFESWSSST